jgi:hypothetical protein
VQAERVSCRNKEVRAKLFSSNSKEKSVKQIRKRLTYANVMSSIAVFLVIGGASALAANQLAKNSVGTKQLKSNAVTTAKIKKNAVTSAKIKKDAVTGAKVKDQSLTGADINLSTLGAVPSANSANSLVGRTPFAFFMGAGLKEVVTIGPFTVKASCVINNAGEDEAELQLYTSVDGAVMDDNSGDEFTPFDVTDNPAEMIEEGEPTGEIGFEAGFGEFAAVGPEGTTIATENQAVGVNLVNHVGQCFFGGTIVNLGKAS